MLRKILLILASVLPTNNCLSAQDVPIPSRPVSDRLIRSFRHAAPTARIADVRFTNDGKLFVAGYPSGMLEFFELRSGRLLKKLETKPGYRGTSDYAFPTPDFQKVYVTQGQTIPAGEGRPVPVNSGEIEIYDLAEQKRLDVIPTSVRNAAVQAAYLSRDGKQLISVESVRNVGQSDNFITVLWNLEDKTPKALVNSYSMAAFSLDNQTIALAVFGKGELKGQFILLDRTTGKEKWSVPAESFQRGFSWPCFLPDGKTLAVLDSEGRIDKPAILKILDAESGKILDSIVSAKDAPFMPPVISPNGKYICVNTYKGGFLLWDVMKRKTALEKEFADRNMMNLQSCFSPDSRLLAVTTSESPKSENARDWPQPVIHIYDTQTRKEVVELVGPPGYCGVLAFSPDGKLLAHGSAGAVHLYDVAK